ncbi:MAG: hypothetical protein P1V97_32355 [Planctomycetota bacterium]|nr:hypothetical protein [Planctomycetota bacterium]
MLRLLTPTLSSVCLALLILSPSISAAEDAQKLCPLPKGAVWTYKVERMTVSSGIKVTRKDAVVMSSQGGFRGKGTYTVLKWREFGKDHVIHVEFVGSKLKVNASKKKIFDSFDFANKKKLGSFKKLTAKIETGQTIQVKKAESIKTNAGQYTAIPVVIITKDVGLTVEKTLWFAKGVGPIKMVESITKDGGLSVNTYELESFIKAGKASGPGK